MGSYLFIAWLGEIQLLSELETRLSPYPSSIHRCAEWPTCYYHVHWTSIGLREVGPEKSAELGAYVASLIGSRVGCVAYMYISLFQLARQKPTAEAFLLFHTPHHKAEDGTLEPLLMGLKEVIW
jgi:hypothetical protein